MTTPTPQQQHSRALFGMTYPTTLQGALRDSDGHEILVDKQGSVVPRAEIKADGDYDYVAMPTQVTGLTAARMSLFRAHAMLARSTPEAPARVDAYQRAEAAITAAEKPNAGEHAAFLAEALATIATQFT